MAYWQISSWGVFNPSRRIDVYLSYDAVGLWSIFCSYSLDSTTPHFPPHGYVELFIDSGPNSAVSCCAFNVSVSGQGCYMRTFYGLNPPLGVPLCPRDESNGFVVRNINVGYLFLWEGNIVESGSFSGAIHNNKLCSSTKTDWNAGVTYAIGDIVRYHKDIDINSGAGYYYTCLRCLTVPPVGEVPGAWEGYHFVSIHWTVVSCCETTTTDNCPTDAVCAGGWI